MIDDPIVEVEQRSALKSAPSALFAGAVADFVRRELRDRGRAWMVRATHQPDGPEYVAWPDVEVERDDGVQAAITCKPGYGVERRTEVLDPHPGRRPAVRSAAVTREASVHNLLFLVYGMPGGAVTYHADLPGLIESARSAENPQTAADLSDLIGSGRLRDVMVLVSDLTA